MKNKIATHDSATGERATWWSVLLTLFARTQRKTLREQYNAGCRLFDIRIKKVFGVWRCAHGWWFTSRSAEDIISDMNSYPERVSVLLTYEGKTKNAGEFLEYTQSIIKKYSHIKYGTICSKYGKDAKGIKVKYDVLIPAQDNWIDAPSEQAFLPLDGRTWHTYLPIPILWKQFYFKNVEFNEEVYKFVDFL